MAAARRGGASGRLTGRNDMSKGTCRGNKTWYLCPHPPCPHPTCPHPFSILPSPPAPSIRSLVLSRWPKGGTRRVRHVRNWSLAPWSGLEVGQVPRSHTVLRCSEVRVRVSVRQFICVSSASARGLVSLARSSYLGETAQRDQVC